MAVYTRCCRAQPLRQLGFLVKECKRLDASHALKEDADELWARKLYEKGVTGKPRKWRNGLAQLAGMAWLNTKTVYPRTVTHLSTNPARRRPTSLIRQTTLPLSHAATQENAHTISSLGSHIFSPGHTLTYYQLIYVSLLMCITGITYSHDALLRHAVNVYNVIDTGWVVAQTCCIGHGSNF